jgi:hypothetical protein
MGMAAQMEGSTWIATAFLASPMAAHPRLHPVRLRPTTLGRNVLSNDLWLCILKTSREDPPLCVA